MKQLFFSLFLLAGAAGNLHAQGFTYHPINPNFGGNTFNYQYLLSQAQAQDRNVDPASRRSSTATSTQTSSTLDNFSQSIENQILQRISSRLISNQFGEGELKPGTYTFGTYQVDIQNGADGVIVRIVDGKGGETSLTIPYF